MKTAATLCGADVGTTSCVLFCVAECSLLITSYSLNTERNILFILSCVKLRCWFWAQRNLFSLKSMKTPAAGFLSLCYCDVFLSECESRAALFLSHHIQQIQFHDLTHQESVENQRDVHWLFLRYNQSLTAFISWGLKCWTLNQRPL